MPGGSERISPIRTASTPRGCARMAAKAAVIAAKGKRAPFARHCESLPIGREYRSVDRPHKLCSSVTLRDLIEREGEGL
jgi:hypothetical protein